MCSCILLSIYPNCHRHSTPTEYIPGLNVYHLFFFAPRSKGSVTALNINVDQSLLITPYSMSKETEKPCHKDDPTCAAERHSEFYFNDGTIVLSAEYSATAKPTNDKGQKKTSGDCSSDFSTSAPLETTKRRIFFRVHKSLLVSASQVFADMFDVSSGTNADLDMYDGVPLVHLPDPAEDIEVMVDTLYGSTFTRLCV